MPRAPVSSNVCFHVLVQQCSNVYRVANCHYGTDCEQLVHHRRRFQSALQTSLEVYLIQVSHALSKSHVPIYIGVILSWAWNKQRKEIFPQWNGFFLFLVRDKDVAWRGHHSRDSLVESENNCIFDEEQKHGRVSTVGPYLPSVCLGAKQYRAVLREEWLLECFCIVGSLGHTFPSWVSVNILTRVL